MASLCSSQLGYCELWMPNLIVCSKKNKIQPSPPKNPCFQIDDNIPCCLVLSPKRRLESQECEENSD